MRPPPPASTTSTDAITSTRDQNSCDLLLHRACLRQRFFSLICGVCATAKLDVEQIWTSPTPPHALFTSGGGGGGGGSSTTAGGHPLTRWIRSATARAVPSTSAQASRTSARAPRASSSTPHRQRKTSALASAS